MHFSGREKELKDLEARYQEGRFELAVVYGRRRVGKTTLIRKFIEGRKAVYFLAVEAGEVFNLAALSAAIYQCTDAGRELPPFQSFDQAFRHLGEAAKLERIVLAIDEYPYLATAFPPVSSMLQAAIDQYLKDTKIFIILCGSSMSFMENQVLGYKSPLYGRRTAQYRIRPFTFFETRDYLRNMDAEDAAVLYGATGGVADYLSFVRQSKSLQENIVRLFLTSSGRLFEEPSNLMKQELREPRVYNDILGAIASGASRNNEIADRAHLPANAMNRYFASLAELGIVRRENPVGSSGARKSIYRLEDSMFRFWYRFVAPNMNAVALGLGDEVFEKAVSPFLSTFMGQVFERIAIDYLDRRQVLGTLPFFVSECGRWWGNNPVKKQEEKIDIVALSTEGAVFGECKWRTQLTDAHEVKRLIEKSMLIDAKSRYFMFFSRSGFTEGAFAMMHEMENLELITFENMLTPGGVL